MGLRVQLVGDREVNLRLDAAARAVSDWTPFFRTTASDLINKSEVEAWETEGASLGAPWVPLALSTGRQKLRGALGQGKRRPSNRQWFTAWGGATRILYVSGALMRAASNPQAPGGEEMIDRLMYVRRVTLPYGAAHQFGVPGRLPARPFLVFSRVLVDKLQTAATEYVQAALDAKVAT